MNRPIRVIVVLGVLAAVVTLGMLLWQGSQSFAFQCEVCVQFNQRSECRTARGSTAEEATRTAQDLACAPLVGSRAEIMACGRRPPTRVECTP